MSKLVVAVVLTIAFVANAQQYDCGPALAKSFRDPNGPLILSWQFDLPNPDWITIQWVLPGATAPDTQWSSLGFCISAPPKMNTSDIIVFINTGGDSYRIEDRYAPVHGLPPTDTELGGFDSVKPVCHKVVSPNHVVRFARQLNTNDRFDAVIRRNAITPLIYAWISGDTGKFAYHGSNKRMVNVTLTV